MPLMSACSSRLPTGHPRHARSSARLRGAVAAEARGDLEQPLGRVRPAVQDHVLAAFAEFRRDLLVDAELARVDDAHVEARADRVIEEDGVHRLAHGVVAAERERDVADAAARLRSGAAFLDLPHGLDEGDAVAGMLLDAGRDREDVRVEDDVLGIEAGAVDQQAIRALADRDLALHACRPGPARRRP